MIELSALRVALVAAEEKNFSQAARRLHLCHSAVSQNIRAIVQIDQVALFRRQRLSVTLSDRGETILPIAQKGMRALRLPGDALSEIKNQVVGQLMTGCSTSAENYLLPVLLSIFPQTYPPVHARAALGLGFCQIALSVH